jgi:hypothetical protein
MRTVWKYQLTSARRQVVHMPLGAEILWLEMLHDLPTIWAMVDDKAPLVGRTIAWYETGEGLSWPAVISDDFIATTIRNGGRAVAHFFDHGES